MPQFDHEKPCFNDLAYCMLWLYQEATDDKMRVPLIDLQAQFSTIQEEIHGAVERVLQRQKFILDQEVAALEEEIAGLTGTNYAVGCANGTDALLLSLIALELQPGDEVITTSYSFFSTAGMIAWLKAKPVFVDIKPDTFNMDVDQVYAKITSKTRAILAVHLFGQCCEIERLMEFELPVVEDAAQAIGAYRHQRHAGSIGITGCFSFFPTKNLGGYGDGGMITTSDLHLRDRIRQLRIHGRSGEYVHAFVGTNSRLDEIQAAILRAKLKHLSSWNKKRNENASFYLSRLSDLPLHLPKIVPGNSVTHHQFVIRCPDRESLRKYLGSKEVSTGVYYPLPLHLQPCFESLGYKTGDFPIAEECAKTSLALPIYPELSEEQLEYVVSAIRTFFQ